MIQQQNSQECSISRVSAPAIEEAITNKFHLIFKLNGILNNVQSRLDKRCDEDHRSLKDDLRFMKNQLKKKENEINQKVQVIEKVNLKSTLKLLENDLAKLIDEKESIKAKFVSIKDELAAYKKPEILKYSEDEIIDAFWIGFNNSKLMAKRYFIRSIIQEVRVSSEGPKIFFKIFDIPKDPERLISWTKKMQESCEINLL